MYITRKNKVYLENYSSVRDFLDVLDSREYTEHAEYKRQGYQKSFQGLSTYEEALGLLVNGYTEPVKALNGIKANDSGQSIRPRYERAIVGESVIVPLALAGVPNCMLTRRQAPYKSKIVRLAIDVGRSGNVETYQIKDWGRKIVALIRGLEANGYRVEATAMATVSDWLPNEPVYAFRIPLKRASQPLDIKRLCFPLIHPAFQRVFKFDWYDRLPDSEPNWGYGSALAYQTETMRERFLPALLQPDEHYINILTDFDSLNL